LKGVVIDAAVALACFPDEASTYADGVLVALEGEALLVPAVWTLEIANALLAGDPAGAPLATVDGKRQKAPQKAGMTIFGGGTADCIRPRLLRRSGGRLRLDFVRMRPDHLAL
jgi:hypothetical protein